jgi:hypothetical protein
LASAAAFALEPSAIKLASMITDSVRERIYLLPRRQRSGSAGGW